MKYQNPERYPLQFCDSYVKKLQWNRTVESYKKEIFSFERYSDIGINKVLYGAEMPPIKTHIRNLVIEIMVSLYNTNKQSFIFKPTFSSDDSPELQTQLNEYSIFVKEKLDSTNDSNFTIAVKNHIEDAVMLGLGVTFIQNINKELVFVAIKPELFEFDICNTSGIPNRFYILENFEKCTTSGKLTQHSYYEIKKDGKWKIFKWKTCKNQKSNRGSHPNKFDEDNYLYCFKNNFWMECDCESVVEYDFCPIIYTRFNLKSNEFIGEGLGLELLPIIREAKSFYNAFRNLAHAEANKPAIAKAGTLTQMNNPNVKYINYSTNEKMPVLEVNNSSGLSDSEKLIHPLKRELNYTPLMTLINITEKKIRDTLALDTLVIAKNTEEMTVPEVKIRNEKGKVFLDAYISELKLTFETAFRIAFKFYMSSYRKSRNDDYLLGGKSKKTKKEDILEINEYVEDSTSDDWVKYYDDKTKLNVVFISESERNIMIQKVTDISMIADIQSKIIANYQQLNLKPDEIIANVNDITNNLGLGTLVIAKNENEEEEILSGNGSLQIV